MPPVIEVKDLVKSYGELRAVDGITFSVESGEFFGILGPNGAGKTTTLEMIEGLREPDAGEVRLLGAPPWPRDIDLCRRIGVQLQSSAFFEKLTAREQLRTFADLYGSPHSRVDELLDEVGLADKGDESTDDLSGGQKQRLSIACTLVNDPEVVFLDEPTAALDPQARRNLWDLLGRLNDRGRTVVLTTHSMEEAEALCDRVAIVDRGKLLAIDSPTNLVRELDAPVRIALVRGSVTEDRARSVVGVESVQVDGDSIVLVTRDPAPVLTELARLDALEGLQVRGGTLEDVFLNLTGREYRA
ncbi:MAG: ABC transporter ATP-binding protein [Acidimicrobiales bacterium]|nr:ABC transporter ATP-binding protein [Acidimicrobiales bacterium]